jgi:hypothetical protein
MALGMDVVPQVTTPSSHLQNCSLFFHLEVCTSLRIVIMRFNCLKNNKNKENTWNYNFLKYILHYILNFLS